jgi:hypothetical protein
MKFQNQRAEKLAAGSRFNLRYPNGVDSDALTLAAVVQALDEYATFPAGIATASNASYSPSAPATASSVTAAPGQVRKGCRPRTSSRYNWQDGILEADFFNGVLVAYRTSSK